MHTSTVRADRSGLDMEKRRIDCKQMDDLRSMIRHRRKLGSDDDDECFDDICCVRSDDDDDKN